MCVFRNVPANIPCYRPCDFDSRYGGDAFFSKLVAWAKTAGFSVPVLIHPTAYVSPDAVLSPGCIVRAKAVVSRYARLGETCIVNVGGLIDHDCVLGDGCHILMGTVVRNAVVLPEKIWLASNQVAE